MKKFPEIQISGWFFVFLAVILLTVPLPWILAAVLAALFHEFCHIAVILILGGKIHGFMLYPGGAVLEVSDLNPGRELLSAAAGPAGSFLLMIFVSSFPRLCVCGLIQGLYNLLPIYPLDGGRILSCGLRIFMCEAETEKISRVVEKVTVSALIVFSVLGCFCYSWGYQAAILIFLGIFKGFYGKIPCKAGSLRVQ